MVKIEEDSNKDSLIEAKTPIFLKKMQTRVINEKPWLIKQQPKVNINKVPSRSSISKSENFSINSPGLASKGRSRKSSRYQKRTNNNSPTNSNKDQLQIQDVSIGNLYERKSVFSSHEINQQTH